MPDVFLSYSREDQPTVRRYAEALEREGFKVWWDSALNPGETFDQVTEQALKEARAVVVLWSKHSVTSRWVRSEATQADRYGKLVPVTIESCDRPIMFELTHTIDLSGWNGDRDVTAWRDFVVGLKRLVEKSGPSISASSVTTPAPPQKTRRAAFAWAAIVALIAIGAGLYWHFQGRKAHAPTTSAGSPAAAAASPAALASIAVLPFKDMSQNKDQEYFADGVTEEILNTLAGLKDLKVTARTSAFAFKGKDVDLGDVGKTLGVNHILEGSIRKDGETLRITAQLIDTKSDAHVWSKTYERPLKDIFKIQDEIARSVAESLQVALGVGFGNRPGMTRDVEAYDALLATWPLLLRYTPETQRRAIGLAEQAIAKDPNYADAWLTLADAYGGMAGLVTEDAQSWRQKADDAIENARRVAPGHPGLIFLLASRSIRLGHWTDAAAHFDDLAAAASKLDALGADPRGRFLLMVGRTREALVTFEQAKARDPLNPQTSFYLGVAYSTVRDFAGSAAEFQRGYSLDPDWQYLFLIGALSNALATRDHAEILRLIETPVSGSLVRQVADIDKYLLDRPADALKILRKLVRDPSAAAVRLLGTSQWLAYFGDNKSALEALRLAFERGASDSAGASTWYPVFRDVRRLPEFKQLVRDVGFVDYWKKYGWGDFCKPTSGDDFECN